MPQVAAQLWTTGPAHVYVGPTNPNSSLAAQAFYLGTGESAPQIEIRPGEEPVFNDLGGTKVPFDVLAEGEEGFTFVDLNRYNEGTLAILQARPRHFSGGTRGTQIGGDVGTLMLTEGQAFSVYVVFPYAAKAAYAGMPAGYRFPFSTLVGPDKLTPLGTRARKVALIFHHLRGFYGTTGVFGLYDHNVAGLPAPL